MKHAHLSTRQIFSTGIAVPAGFWVYSERFLEHEHGELSINDREFTLLIRPKSYTNKVDIGNGYPHNRLLLFKLNPNKSNKS